MAAGFRTRRWCFTLNNYTDEDERRIQELECRYIIYGREVAPDTGTKHLQGYISLNQPCTFGAIVARIGGGAHVEGAKGNEQQNYAYCSKDGNFFERGKRANQGGAGKFDETKWDDARKAARQGHMDEIPSSMYIRYIKNFKQIRSDELQKNREPDLDAPCGLWWWGVPGAGKSYKARKDYPGIYIKMHNKWWDQYDPSIHQWALLDDLGRDTAAALSEHIKQWSDEYAFPVELKGGSHFIRPKVFLVTSNFSLDECFPEPTLNAAMRRRFKVTHFGVKWHKGADQQVRGQDKAEDDGKGRDNSPKRSRSRSPPQQKHQFESCTAAKQEIQTPGKTHAEERELEEAILESEREAGLLADAVIDSQSPYPI